MITDRCYSSLFYESKRVGRFLSLISAGFLPNFHIKVAIGDTMVYSIGSRFAPNDI